MEAPPIKRTARLEPPSGAVAPISTIPTRPLHFSDAFSLSNSRSLSGFAAPGAWSTAPSSPSPRGIHAGRRKRCLPIPSFRRKCLHLRNRARRTSKRRAPTLSRENNFAVGSKIKQQSWLLHVVQPARNSSGADISANVARDRGTSEKGRAAVTTHIEKRRIDDREMRECRHVRRTPDVSGRYAVK